MKLSVALAAALATAVAGSKFSVTSEDVKCYSGPSSRFEVVKTYKKTEEIDIDCQIINAETRTGGRPVWDRTHDGCFVVDDNVHTGSKAYVTDECKLFESKKTLESRDVIGDDYPYKGQCGPADEWNMGKCQCTSFAAWRVNNVLGKPLNGQYLGCHFFDANTWDDCGRQVGIPVDSSPTVGSIAQGDAGQYGHVAWVAAVNGDMVQLEEYNFNIPLDYDVRVIPVSDYVYVHF